MLPYVAVCTCVRQASQQYCRDGVEDLMPSLQDDAFSLFTLPVSDLCLFIYSLRCRREAYVIG